jgi:hypothetical protein
VVHAWSAIECDPALIENLLHGIPLAAGKLGFLKEDTHVRQGHQKLFKDLLNLHDEDQVQRYLYKVMSQGVHYIWAYI